MHYAVVLLMPTEHWRRLDMSSRVTWLNQIAAMVAAFQTDGGGIAWAQRVVGPNTNLTWQAPIMLVWSIPSEAAVQAIRAAMERVQSAGYFSYMLAAGPPLPPPPATQQEQLDYIFGPFLSDLGSSER